MTESRRKNRTHVIVQLNEDQSVDLYRKNKHDRIIGSFSVTLPPNKYNERIIHSINPYKLPLFLKGGLCRTSIPIELTREIVKEYVL